MRKFLAPQAKFLDPNEEKHVFLLIFRRKFLIFPPQLRKFSSQTSKYPMLPSSGRFPQLAEKFPQFCELGDRKKNITTRVSIDTGKIESLMVFAHFEFTFSSILSRSRIYYYQKKYIISDTLDFLKTSC